MSRPRRKPAPPGRVHVVCSHRGDPRYPGTKQLDILQMRPDGNGEITFTALNGPPIEGYAYRYRCGICRRNAKIRKERMLPLVMALAEMQGTHGDTPVVVDISHLDRAL